MWNLKEILTGIGVIAAFVVVIVLIKGIDSYFEDRSVRKEYAELQGRFDHQKDSLTIINKIHQDSIDKLKYEVSYLGDSLLSLNREIDKLESRKPQVIYRTQKMSVIEQEKYFADRYGNTINDSITKVSVIQDLELGDICKEEVKLQRKQIDILQHSVDDLNKIIAHQDSIISNHQKIELVNREKFFQAEQQIDYERQRGNKFRRQRNLTAISGGVILLLIGFAVVD